MNLDFAAPGMGNDNVLQDFDFDSFLNQDGVEGDSFTYDASAFIEGAEVGAE